MSKKDSLEHYYGKTLYYVVTTLSKGKVGTTIQERKVYNPKDRNCNMEPCTGCDMVIGNNSVDSKRIFKIGGVIPANDTDYSWNQVCRFNYCTKAEVKTVIKKQENVVKESVSLYIKKLEKDTKSCKRLLDKIS